MNTSYDIFQFCFTTPCFPFGHSLSLTEHMLNQRTQRLSYSRVMEVDNVTYAISFVDCENVCFAVTCWDIPIGRNSWNWLWHGCQRWVWVRKKRMVSVSKQLVHMSPFICIRPIVHLYCSENQGIVLTRDEWSKPRTTGRLRRILKMPQKFVLWIWSWFLLCLLFVEGSISR